VSQKVTIFHNPRCSTSRKALDLIRSRGIEPEIVEYLKNPPTREELIEVLDKLKASPGDLIRKKEKLYAELDLEGASNEALIDAMVEYPILIERPVVIKGKKAALGRPLESIERLL
jgi:arsenate reductase